MTAKSSRSRIPAKAATAWRRAPLAHTPAARAAAPAMPDADLLARFVPELDLTWRDEAGRLPQPVPLRLPLPSDLPEADRALHPPLLAALRSALLTWPQDGISAIALETREAMQAEFRGSPDWRRLDLGLKILREVGRSSRRNGQDMRLELPRGRRPQAALTARIGLERDIADIFTDFAAAATRIISCIDEHGAQAAIRSLAADPSAFGRIRPSWRTAWVRSGWEAHEVERIVNAYREAASDPE
ncbi:MAG: hypothetical protein J0H82_27270 [Alphaproteobacteria bacterium]|nr:hypothetical protein [Alphaproteobacteria bacterium]